MASVTKSNDGMSAMSDDELTGDQPDAEQAPASTPKSQKGEATSLRRETREPAGPSYFTIYKKGQGYWTRVGTVVGIGVIGAFTAYNLYAYTPIFLPASIIHPTAVKIALGVALGFALAYAIIAWRMMNKPTHVDFLIATDSEMKKVNWTSRRELIGSTKVVVIFMFLTALFLFVCDIVFIFTMRLLHVLKFGYFG